MGGAEWLDFGQQPIDDSQTGFRGCRLGHSRFQRAETEEAALGNIQRRTRAAALPGFVNMG